MDILQVIFEYFGLMMLRECIFYFIFRNNIRTCFELADMRSNMTRNIFFANVFILMIFVTRRQEDVRMMYFLIQLIIEIVIRNIVVQIYKFRIKDFK